MKLLLTHFEYLKMQKESTYAAKILSKAYEMTTFVSNYKNEDILKECARVIHVSATCSLESGNYSQALTDYYKAIDFY